MASTLFLSKIQPKVRSGDQSFYYRCSFLTRNGDCASERGLTTKGPKNLSCCRRHARLYDEEREQLVARLERDHEQGLHGTGDDRKPFAETHTDDSGFFSLRCIQCRDDIEADELGVSADKLADATKIRRYVERVQTGLTEARKAFKEMVDQDRIVRAMDYHGPDIRKLEKEAAYVQAMLNYMEHDKVDIVDAYFRVSEHVKENLLLNHLSEEEDRKAAVRFTRVTLSY